MAKSTRSPIEHFMARMIKDMKRRSKETGFEFDQAVTIDFLVGLWHGQKGLDAHTGLPMGLVRGLENKNIKPELCTPDRILNTEGYTVDNIMLACWCINKMRGDMELNQFRNTCKLIGLNAK